MPRKTVPKKPAADHLRVAASIAVTRREYFAAHAPPPSHDFMEGGGDEYFWPWHYADAVLAREGQER